jgi:nicotinate-nucleotide adenylyltransferase
MGDYGLKKIGLFGGSFDPIHFGHINLAVCIKEFHELDEVWFCPSYQSPAKENLPTSSEKRIEMLNIALKNIPWARIINYEVQRPTLSYTIDTIESLLSEHKDVKLYLIIGDDAIENLHLWKNIDKIISLCPLLIGRRSCHLPVCKGSDALKSAVLKGLSPSKSLMQIESTKLRNRISLKQYCYHLAPEKVLDYIYQNQLYS